MIYTKEIAIKIATELLRIKAVRVAPNNPFTWASGLRSPIYCDNRLTLGYPEIRSFLAESFSSIIRDKFDKCAAISAVATAGIAHGLMVAESLSLPFSYVRSKPKEHGKQKLIEGVIPKETPLVVIEDLFSTGGSTLRAIEALKDVGCNVIGTIAIMTYSFPETEEKFNAKNIPMYTLCDYQTLVDTAISLNYIETSDLKQLELWSEDRLAWSNLQS